MKAGQLITDDGVTWIVDDVRDGTRVGDILLRPTLRDGYIKANGATVRASEYPRLLAWVQESNMTVTAEQYAQDCSKYVYDAAQDKLTLPNMTGRVLQGGETVKSVEAGLPNIHIKDAGLSAFGVGYTNGKKNGVIFTGKGGEDVVLGSGRSKQDIEIDVSTLNPIYGASDTVQAQAITMIAQIKY